MVVARKPFIVLIADDDASLIAPFLNAKIENRRDSIRVELAESPERILELTSTNEYDLVFLDVDFGRGQVSGLDLIEPIKKFGRAKRVVMLSSQDDSSSLMQALKHGADDFLSKRTDKICSIPLYLESLLVEHETKQQDLAEAHRLAELVGAGFCSAAMLEVFCKVVVARRNTQLPVLITGETGSGKEVVASAISIASDRPRIAIDCGAISEGIAESELFGHVRGAFTGADRPKVGKLALAQGGEVFLDEIGNLKRSIQEKLLRAIQLYEITPVGGTVSQKIDSRIVAATNENLEQLVIDGKFRSDLLERLKGVWIEIPPLRNRLEDLEPLIVCILRKQGRSDVEVAATCIAVFKSYDWPGNVRELESVIAEMLANSGGAKLTISHLPEKIKQRILYGKDRAAPAATAAPMSSNATGFIPKESGSWDSIVDDLFKYYLPKRFQSLGPRASQRELAASLGLARNTLSSHLKRLNIQFGDDALTEPLSSVSTSQPWRVNL